MKRINFEDLDKRNNFSLGNFMGVIKMEFIKHNKGYLIKDSNGIIVSEEEKLKLEKNELILKDMSSNNCQGETTKEIAKIDKKLKSKKDDTIKKANKSI